MKKVFVILLCLLMLCSCQKKEKESIFKKNDISYVEYKDTKIYLKDDFSEFVNQFKKLDCKFITRTGNDDKEIEFKDIKDDNEIYSLTTGNSFIITCNNNSSSTANFTEYFKETDNSLYKDRKIKEWHISSTNDEIDIVIGKQTIYFGLEKYDTVKTLKEKLGKVDSETKTDKGFLERLVYVSEDYKYEFLVLNPINNNEDNIIYNLYVVKE